MRIAAIDIGTNSLHMIVCRIRPDLSFEVVDREKDMVRLGTGGLDGRQLAEPSMSAAIQTLSKFTRHRRLARRRRDRRRGHERRARSRQRPDFIAAVRRAVGLRIQVISGTEEARLIHMAAAYSARHRQASRPSSWTSAAAAPRSRSARPSGCASARSFKLGVIRLTERFVTTDPIADHDRRRLVRHIRTQAGPAPRRDLETPHRARDRHLRAPSSRSGRSPRTSDRPTMCGTCA